MAHIKQLKYWNYIEKNLANQLENKIKHKTKKAWVHIWYWERGGLSKYQSNVKFVQIKS